MAMIVQKACFVELLQHSDERVRDCCVEALARFFPHSEGIMSHLLQAIRAYPEHCLSLAYHLRFFIPSDDDIPHILQLYHDTAEAQDENSLSIHYHAISGFVSFPFEIVERQRELFDVNQELREQYEILQHREEFRCRPFEELWNELEEFCQQNTGKEVDHETHQYAELLVEGLARHPEQVKDNVIAVLNEANPDNYLLEEYLVPLAGTLKLEETIPALFRILNETDFMYIIHQSCKEALGKIGTPQVLEGIGRYYEENEELRTDLAVILEYMPYEYTEDFAIRLLEREQAIENKTFIAGSLCDIFSLKATNHIKELIETRHYDPTIMSLTDHLIPIYVYHNQDVDWSHLERIDKEFHEKTFKESPLYETSQKIRQVLKNMEKRKLQEEEQPQKPQIPIREKKEPIPQKKGKAALRRAKKRKKKKRR